MSRCQMPDVGCRLKVAQESSSLTSDIWHLPSSRRAVVGLLDVYRGRQTWADFIGGRASFTALEELSPRRTRDASTDDKSETLSVGLTARDHRVAVESGLGALNPERLRQAG